MGLPKLVTDLILGATIKELTYVQGRGPSGSKWGRLIVRRPSKKRGVYSHNCNKLNKTNMLLQGLKFCKVAFWRPTGEK